MTDQNEQAVETAKASRDMAITVNGSGVELKTLDDMHRVAKWIVHAGMAVKDDTPESVVIKIQMGKELGLTPMTAVQNIAVINGRPSVWGDAMPGLVRAGGHMEYLKEEEIGTYPNKDYGWRITSKRKDDPNPMTTTFTIEDATTASLWGKVGPWKQYPKRMLKMRARGFNLRDNFADDLKGINLAEEMRDMPVMAEYTVEDTRPRTEKLVALIAPKSEPEQEEVAETEQVTEPIESADLFNQKLEPTPGHSKADDNMPLDG